MLILYSLTAVLLLLSCIASKNKTFQALQTAWKRFRKVLPAFLSMLIFIAMSLYLIPEDQLLRMLAPNNRWLATGTALGLGSLSIMPGFIAFPLCGILLERGALYMVLSAFSTTLMMVGIATFHLEKDYLGTRLALYRNIASFFIAIAVALATGLWFGELQ